VPEHSQNDPFIIMCAPNGARRTYADHPKLPITPTELAYCAEEIRDAGASILHLHVRDEHQQHSLNVDHYKRAIDAITDKTGDSLIIQVTSEAVGRYTRQDQMNMVKAMKPEAVSLALCELAPDTAEHAEVSDFFSWMAENKIWPQIILYDQADYWRFKQLQKKGVFGDRQQFLLFVLKKTGPEPDKTGLSQESLVQLAPKVGVPWAACCFGAQENTLSAFCSQNGGHVRVGFENNIWINDGSLAVNNAELVKNAQETAHQNNKKVATANEVRKLLGVGNLQQ